jgi:hypothetical protein
MSVGCMALFYTRFLVEFSIFRRNSQAVLMGVSAKPLHRLRPPAIGGRFSGHFCDISAGQVKDNPAIFRGTPSNRNGVGPPFCRDDVFL